MARKLGALVACLLMTLPGCSKSPPAGLSGASSLRMKDPVHATFGWSRGQIVYIIYFVPSPGAPFNADNIAATAKISKDPKEADTFEGALDGNPDKGQTVFKANAKSYEVLYEGRTFRMANGKVLLINVGTPSKVQQLQVVFGQTPKDPEQIPEFVEHEVRRLAKENPRIGDFPKEPPSEKPDKTKKK